MRRTALVLVVLAGALGLAAAGCGGEEEASPTPETVTGPLPTETTTTDTTETDTTETTDTTDTTDTTETETTTEPADEGDPVAGKEVFLGASACGGCHTLSDAGATGNVGPNLDDTQPSFDLVVDRVTNGTSAGMPPFKDTLSEQQIADVAAYVSSVAGS
ncbi:MAG TPA: c-type cytochrome [Gaiellaceae bacterium]|nr:c-type cytochrome [Gaiellaceae bacterium]